MAKISQPPTPNAAINVLLHRLLTGAQAALGDNFFGMYLYGSLASGDFDERSSDVDFVVVTRGEVGEDVVEKLRALHEGLWQNGGKWAAKLEGAYVPLEMLRKHEPNAAKALTVNERQLYVDVLGSDWIIQRHILREYPKTLAGPPLREWIDPVSPDELKRAVADILFGFWRDFILTHPDELQRADYQPFAVLTMARAQYAFATGTIVSKPVAARWALEHLDARWRGLIERALTQEVDLSKDGLSETLAFIRETVNIAETMERG